MAHQDKTKKSVTIPYDTLKLAGVFVLAFVLGAIIAPFEGRGSSGSVVQGDSAVDPGPWLSDVRGLDLKAIETCMNKGTYSSRIADDIGQGSVAGVGGTPSFFIGDYERGFVLLVGAQSFEAFKQVIDAELADGGASEERAQLQEVGAAFMGNEDAPLVIVEYSDFQCPFCRSFYERTLPQLKSEYIETGKARLEYRHFPLSFHLGAAPSAEAFECAREQGKEWDVHDTIFEKQAKYGTGTVQFTEDNLI